jgi:hypothetical protein
MALALSLATAAGASAAQLPEFNLLGTTGSLSGNYTTLTSMDMSTGVFAGSSVTDGESFSVTGMESGDTVDTTYTYLADTSYQSFNVATYGILADGNIGGPGEFTDTNGTHETYTTELNLPAGTTPSVTAAVCSPSGAQDTCTAKVSGASGTPTGNVTFSSSTGSFSGPDACVLAGGSCSVTYVPPAGRGALALTAVYSGDGAFHVSQGAASVVKTCTVPHLAGKTLSKAKAALAVADCRVGKVTNHSSSTVTKGTVISTSPPAGTSRSAGTAVALTLSSGTPSKTKMCTVPKLKGDTLSKAKTALRRADCGVGKITTAKSKTVAKGRVISSSPKAGSKRKAAAKVSLIVSRGKH